MKNLILKALLAALGISFIGCGGGAVTGGDLDGGLGDDGGYQFDAGSRTADVTLATNTICHVSNATGTFDYKHYQFSDGSLLVQCEYSGNAYTVSSLEMYKATQTGASTGGCSFVEDLDGTANGGWWQFTYNSSSKTATTVYSNVGSSADGTTYVLSCTQI